MLKQALSSLAGEFGLLDLQKEMLDLSYLLAQKVEEKFFLPSENLLIINLPWMGEDGEMRTCERSLAHWVLGGFVPESAKATVLKELTSRPSRLGRCYPANVIWPYWTMAALGNTETIIQDFDQRWLPMLSVRENNTIQEHWHAEKDTQNQLSHAGIAPFYAAYMCFAGIKVLRPGGTLIQVRPQLATLERLQLTYHTSQGPLEFECRGKKGKRKLMLKLPLGVQVQLILPKKEKLPKGAREIGSPDKGLVTFLLEGGRFWEIDLMFV